MSARPSYGAGAASAARIHDAIHSGAIKLVPAPKRREPMTADPLRLDSGIPTLTERHAARHHRNAPHLHLVHRVDTERDLPDGVAGVAIGGTALPEDRDDSAEADAMFDLYAPKTLAAAVKQRDQLRRHERHLWWHLAAVYAFAGLLLVAVIVSSRHQTEIRAALRAAYQAVALFLLGA